MSRDPSETPPRLGRGGRSPRPGRSFRQHLLRRVALVVPAFLLMFVLTKTGLLEKSYDRITFNKLSWFDNTALVEHLRVLITQDGLTSLPRNCLVFLVNGDASANTPTIDVLGRSGNGCPGDKPAADKLFAIKVDRMARRLSTDAGTPGVFHPLGP